jgi:hypothetical protein
MKFGKKKKVTTVFILIGIVCVVLLLPKAAAFLDSEELFLDLGIEEGDVLYDYEGEDLSGIGETRFLVYRKGSVLGVVAAREKAESRAMPFLRLGAGGYELISKYLVDLDKETVNSIFCRDLLAKGILFPTSFVCHHGKTDRDIYLGITRKDSPWLGSQDVEWMMPVTEKGDLVLFLALSADAKLFAGAASRLRLY